MASLSATSLRFGYSINPTSCFKTSNKISSVKFSFGTRTSSFPSLRSLRVRASSEATPETVNKVMAVVKKQLALTDDISLTPQSTFSGLGADSLDTVEIVMGLEEEFGITVEEDNSQSISTVQEAADLIEKLVQQKAGAA
ncbi:acyl carrier protein 4, chloroplastic-like [Typha angustifolia]|uniref:acyl carrier protein 4, chloroplastic-like n=1 Tax=Typha angustifolia TaxID=59011 RepID=UPI003C2F8DEE